MADFRVGLRGFLTGLLEAESADARIALEAGCLDDSAWDVADPVNRLTGPEEIFEGLILPLRKALAHARRRDILFLGGRNVRRDTAIWCASLAHYVGCHDEPLFGAPPSGRLAFLRSGEFYRVDDAGRIAEAKIILDLVDLMRQAGRMPLPDMLGTEMVFPAPATQDGLAPSVGDGARSLALVERMLDGLGSYDPDTFASDGQTGNEGSWHEDMLWYGPGGVGSSYRWKGFVDDHRAAFLRAFPDREGGDHYCRIGDGNYAAVSGWPSMTMTHEGPYLGIEPTGKKLTLRVMDFYRCAGGKIMENWVCLDYVDLFRQMGVDLLARANDAFGSTRTI